MNGSRRSASCGLIRRGRAEVPAYAERVDGIVSGWPVVLAGLLGLVVGVVAMVAFHLSDREQHRIPPRPEPELDDAKSGPLNLPKRT